MQLSQNSMSGIKGWLLFFVIYSFYLLISNLIGLYFEFYIYMLVGTIGWNLARTISVGIYLFSEVLIIVSLVLILKKKRKGPNIIIQIEIITIIFGFLNFILTINKIDELPSLISTITFGSIWILYFKNSKRVKATFES
ncbi:DUF2569 family protein [Paenibacillus polymyxa]|uniref:DUF2569 family protein n=1 Tax=Paenibacillus polymyxa TaxID=1406 RepID=UPI00046E8BB3|nr:DUF2569 family protein [Paenibacillus polymyxa]